MRIMSTLNGMTTEQFNENFVNMIDDPNFVKEASMRGAQYVKLKLREEGIMRRYFGDDMEPVTPEDPRYQIDIENVDSGYMLLDREPDSYALKMNFRGEPTAEYIKSDKWIVTFLKYISPEFQKDEAELRNIRIPITDLIRKQLVFELQQQEDLYFKKVIDTAIATTGKLHTSTSNYFKKDDLTELYNMIDDDRLEATTVIMARATLNDAYKWNHSEVGTLVKEVWDNGVKTLTLGGKKLILTSNRDVIKRGEIYTLTDTDYFGAAFTLGNPTFWMQKDKTLLKMATWYYAGFNIGNVRSVAKMELSVQPTQGVDN